MCVRVYVRVLCVCVCVRVCACMGVCVRMRAHACVCARIHIFIGNATTNAYHKVIDFPPTCWLECVRVYDVRVM